VAEHRLFDPTDPPAWLDPEWWRDTPNCNHWDHPGVYTGPRIEAVANLACDLFDEGKVSSAVDMGAGDGAVLEQIVKRRPGTDAWGYEIIRRLGHGMPAETRPNVYEAACHGDSASVPAALG
jgi:hypothetical protein